MSSSLSVSTTSNTTDVSPQQIGKAFVVQYYRLLHEHPESLHRFYSSSSTLMHDDPNKTVSGIENIRKRIEELSFKQRHVKIRQVDCHSTVGSSVVVQVCGEMSSSPIVENSTPIMKRFVQTFVLAPAANNKQKYYVHNDIFRYQDNQTSNLTTENNTKTSSITTNNEVASFENLLQTPTSSINIQFTSNTVTKQEDQSVVNANSTTNEPLKIEEKEQSAKPKSYRDAIGKKEKVTATTNENPLTPMPTAAAAAVSGAKATKSPKQKSSKSANRNSRAARDHPQDTNDYYDDSWYYGTGEEGYLHTGYTDDQEIFVGNLSAQVTEQEIHELFRPYGGLLLVRIGNTGSQVGAANFAFVVCQSIEMAKAIVADHDTLFKNQQVHVEAKKRRPFPHTFRPTYPTAAAPTNYQSTGYPTSFYERSSSIPFYDGGVPGRGGRRGGKGGTN